MRKHPQTPELLTILTMATLLEKGDDWSLWRSPCIIHEKDEMITQLGRAYRLFKNTFTGFDSSLTDQGLTLGNLPSLFNYEEKRKEDEEFIKNWGKEKYSGYRFYNIFALTSPSPLFWLLNRDLQTVVRTTLETDEPLWFQCWMNYHNPNNVLNWHDHKFDYHGYISIEPHNTTTEFRQDGEPLYSIKNEVGNIYFGPGWDRQHRVVAHEEFETPRITLGFDIHTQSDLPDDQFSLIPLL